MEGPAQLAAANVIGADITRRRWQGFRQAAANDDQVFIDACWTGQRNRLQFRIAPKTISQINPSIVSKHRNRLAGRGIQSVDEVHDTDQDSFVLLAGPICQAAIRLRTFCAGIEFPQKIARCRVQSEDFLCGCDPVKYSVNNDGAGLQAAAFAGVKTPGHLELLNVLAIDLR